MRDLLDTGTDGFVVFDRVQKSYDGETLVVKDLDLAIGSGEFPTMLGPSGSGKTTCLMMLAGFETATHGDIKLGGTAINDIPPHKRGIGMVFQNYALFPHMSVAENLAFPLEVRNMGKEEREEKVRRALDMVQMGDFGGRRPAQLSGGQQQRIALARALVFDPELVLMDEPLGALDKQLRGHMQFEIKHIADSLGITVVYVTHDQTEALTMSDRVAVFDDGRIQQLATPDELYERPENSFVAQFIGENNTMTGRIDEIRGGIAVVRLDHGELIDTVPVNVSQVSERTRLSIRPEGSRRDPENQHDTGIDRLRADCASGGGTGDGRRPYPRKLGWRLPGQPRRRLCRALQGDEPRRRNRLGLALPGGGGHAARHERGEQRHLGRGRRAGVGRHQALRRGAGDGDRPRRGAGGGAGRHARVGGFRRPDRVGLLHPADRVLDERRLPHRRRRLGERAAGDLRPVRYRDLPRPAHAGAAPDQQPRMGALLRRRRQGGHLRRDRDRGGQDRAFAKLDTIKDQTIWWSAAAEAIQSLADGEAVIGSSYNGRFLSAIEEQDQPLEIIWDMQVFDLDGWVIPESLPEDRLARALDFVNFATDTQRRADQAAYISYGPARDSSAPLVGEHAELGIDMAPHMPTDPANSETVLVYNYEWWADYRDDLDARFQAWLSQ